MVGCPRASPSRVESCHPAVLPQNQGVSMQDMPRAFRHGASSGRLWLSYDLRTPVAFQVDTVIHSIDSTLRPCSPQLDLAPTPSCRPPPLAKRRHRPPASGSHARWPHGGENAPNIFAIMCYTQVNQYITSDYDVMQVHGIPPGLGGMPELA